MVWLVSVMEIVFQVIETIFPVVGWLEKVMARSEKVTGDLAGSFRGTCFGLTPDP